MEDNKKNKIPNVPNLRFNFNGEYSQVLIGDYIVQKGKRAKGNELKYTAYSINNQTGFSVQQEQWGDASYTKLEKNGYKVIEYNDFAYNPARINVGSIGLYKEKTPCIVSSLYVCFAAKSKLNSDYLFKYLKSEKFNKKVLSTQEGGVRTYFFYDKLQKTKIYIPSLPEQYKINEFLDLINRRIETQNKIIEKHESLIKQIRYTIGLNYSMAPKTSLSNLCSIKTGKKDANASSMNGKYPFFTCGKETLLIDTYSFEGKALLVSGNGEIGQVKYYDGKFDAYQRTYVLQNFLVNPKYIKIWLETLLPKVIEKEKNVGAMPYIVVSTLADIKIPQFDTKYENTLLCLFQAIENKLKASRLTLELYRKQKEFLLTNLFI